VAWPPKGRSQIMDDEGLSLVHMTYYVEQYYGHILTMNVIGINSSFINCSVTLIRMIWFLILPKLKK